MAHTVDVAPLVPFIVLRTRATHGARTFPGRVLETRDPPNHLEMRTRTTDVAHEATQFPLSVSSIWSMFASEVGHALVFARNISLQYHTGRQVFFIDSPHLELRVIGQDLRSYNRFVRCVCVHS